MNGLIKLHEAGRATPDDAQRIIQIIEEEVSKNTIERRVADMLIDEIHKEVKKMKSD